MFNRKSRQTESVGGKSSVFGGFRSSGPGERSRPTASNPLAQSGGAGEASQSASTSAPLVSGGEALFERNNKGGIKVDSAELERVWKFMKRTTGDPKESRRVDDSDKLQWTEFLAVMKAIIPTFSAMEARWILKKKDHITFEDFKTMVGDNQVEQTFDPVSDAFAMLSGSAEDPQGYLDLEMVSKVFEELRVGDAPKDVLKPFIEEIAEKLISESQTRGRRQLDEREIREMRRIDLECFRGLTAIRHNGQDAD
mmetsp:Transcript_55187/g.131516  ORF Transcript_55187/g.131516 Transcript_55187/m.131516 type:complete len:253 (+) Transcript_55187:80-838(+)